MFIEAKDGALFGNSHILNRHVFAHTKNKL